MTSVLRANCELAASEEVEKGKKIWVCLDALATFYKNSDMSKISPTSSFDDDTWNVYGENDYNFRWILWLPESKFYPLKLVCKVVAYHEMNVLHKKASTVEPSIRYFLSTFAKFLDAKAILSAERNEPFESLSCLNHQDILLVAQTELARKGGILVGPYRGLDYIVKCPISAFVHAEFLLSGSSAPWRAQNRTVISWLNKLKGLKTDWWEGKSYPPLEFGVVESIVKEIVPIVNEHFDLIKAVFDFINSSPDQNRTTDRVHTLVRGAITKEYGAQLNKILPLRKTPTFMGDVISLKWFTEFEQLIQGAVAWLILLTTGLRSKDMRNLVKGCCQPSKRFDLLWYLVTDITKTNLENYIIPVPPLVQRGIELVELAKVERNGIMLFTQKLNASKDNTCPDRRKIGGGQGFNNLIQSFAANYGIKLKTVLGGDYEATAHCVRATLAGYIGANSHAAILILKRLFGHSNNLMPDAYLANNPIVIRQRRENITKAQDEQAGQMAKAWASRKVTATRGKQLLEGVKYVEEELREELKNESLTEMDFHVRLEQRLKEILLERIRGDDIYALKTSVGVICMRCVSDSTDSPCAKQMNHQRRKELNISKDVTDALATLPNPAHCIGKDCPDALMGEPWSRDLLISFDYYIKLLKGQGHKNLDIVSMAKHYIKAYAPLLKDLYESEREAGYFE